MIAKAPAPSLVQTSLGNELYLLLTVRVIRHQIAIQRQCWMLWGPPAIVWSWELDLPYLTAANCRWHGPGRVTEVTQVTAPSPSHEHCLTSASQGPHWGLQLHGFALFTLTRGLEKHNQLLTPPTVSAPAIKHVKERAQHIQEWNQCTQKQSSIKIRPSICRGWVVVCESVR